MNSKRLFAFSLCIVAIAAMAHGADTSRPDTWAQPIKMPGTPNLHKVSDDLYRSAQPSKQGMKNLKKIGIKTIFNLRAFHSDRDEIGKTALSYEHIRMTAWNPKRKDVVTFLKTASNTNKTPVLVHCMHGSDRTGALCAIYRVAIEGWTKEDAVKEMTKGDFGFHEVWQNIPDWIKDLDIEKIKKDAGIKEKAAETETSTNSISIKTGVRS